MRELADMGFVCGSSSSASTESTTTCARAIPPFTSCGTVWHMWSCMSHTFFLFTTHCAEALLRCRTLKYCATESRIYMPIYVPSCA